MSSIEEGAILTARLARDVLLAADHAGAGVVTAESCTGGYIAALLAGVEGLSHSFKGGVVVYSDEAKMSLLGISAADLDRYGAVSCPIVQEMAKAVRSLTGAEFAVAVSGNTGPRGETANGRVHIAVASPSGVQHQLHEFGEVDRDQGRRRAAVQSLTLLRKALEASGGSASAERTLPYEDEV